MEGRKSAGSDPDLEVKVSTSTSRNLENHIVYNFVKLGDAETQENACHLVGPEKEPVR